MNEFTASNGIEVSKSAFGGVYVSDRVAATEAEELALREFFRAEEDERLGRWRWPENPDYVVYPADSDDEEGAILIMFEPGGGSARHYTRKWLASVFDPDGWAVARCARAYFDAHPEPKPPWHEAQPGDVWLLTFTGFEMDEASPWTVRPGAMSTDPSEFVYPQNGNTLALNDPDIVDARRLWPEVA